jgi:hypothetical protein
MLIRSCTIFNVMPAYRQNANGDIEVFAHRIKTLLVAAGIVLLAGVSVLATIADPTEWWTWVGTLLFGVGGFFWLRRYFRAGIFTGKPALVVRREGIHDRQSGMRLEWREVEGVELWEMSVRGTTQRYLGLWVTEPDAVGRRLSSGVRLLSALNRIGQTGHPSFNISTTLLATTTEELAGLLRRFYDGPIDGVEGPIDTTPERRSRARRFLAWATDWAVAIAIAIGIVVLIVWLS